MIVYLRVVPGFQVAVEERDHLELRLRPLIIGSSPNAGRGIVREANTVAQRCGVQAGMSLAQARQYCPEAVFLVPDLAHYELVWEQTCEILREYTPLVEPIEPGQAVCNLSGCERLWGDSWEAAHRIALQVYQRTGISVRLGVASTRLVAELASLVDNGEGVTVVDGSGEAFLAGLPITLLPEVDPRLALTFKVLGLKTIGQFAGLPVAAVRQRFGAAGERLHRYARGIDDRPVLPPPPRPSVFARYNCDDGSIEEVADAIFRLANDCAEELQHRGLAGKLITLKLEWEGTARRIEAPSNSGLPSPAGPPRPPEAQREAAFPVAYRIHSMLPQPAPSPSGSPSLEVHSALPDLSDKGRYVARQPGVVAPLMDARPSCEEIGAKEDPGPAGESRAKTAVRTAISTAPPLVEHAQRLLLELWPRTAASGFTRRAGSVELDVSEFEAPRQLSFAELLRFDGGLGGRLADPRGALLEQERLLAARHGDAAFRHVTQVDPESVLTERRFRWQSGLSPNRKKPHRKKR